MGKIGLWKRIFGKEDGADEPPVPQQEPAQEQQAAEEAPAPPPEAPQPSAPADAAAPAPQEQEPEPDQAPQPARAEVTVSPDRMEAYIRVSRPENGGADITPEEIRRAVDEAEIAAAIADSVVKTIVRFKLYEKAYTIAKGVPPVDGEDGAVKDHYRRTQEIRLEADAAGRVDYKNLHLIQNVHEGDVICDIIPPTQQQEGRDVFGSPVRGVDGKPAKIPNGRNTLVSEDGLKLLAACPGNLIFDNGYFRIETELRIAGNVDNAVGNLDFSGSVVVEGDVCEGFTVKSGKDVDVHGSVEGAVIEAEGNIVLAKGMNGMLKGRLRAGGDIHCRFLENCEVHAKGSVFAESVLNSNVSADDRIVVQGRRGVIVGGTCTARNTVEAKVVGAMSHTPTDIVLGATPEALREHKVLTQQEAELSAAVDMMQKDIQYLIQLSSKGNITKDRLRALKEKRDALQEKEEELEAVRLQLESVNQQIGDIEACRLSCMEIHPPARVMMGSATLTVVTAERNCSFYYAEGEIKRGTTV